MRSLHGRAPVGRAWIPVLLFLTSVTPARAGAQDLVNGMAGGALGLIGGGFVSIGIVAAEARRGVYISSVDDAFGWEAAPIPIGLATGVVLGLRDPARGRRVLVGALLGTVAGAGLGALLGDRVWSDPERRWAGGLIGGATGLLAGAVAGAIAGREPDDPAGVAVELRVPLPR